jgi:hypothetical protein
MPGDHEDPDIRIGLDKLVYYGSLGGVAGSFLLFALFLLAEWQNPGWNGVFMHFPATIGLPCAAAASFTIVSLFRTTEGKITFQALGFKFEGASGPIIMWVLCFLAITTAIRILWPLTLPS